MIFKKKIIIGIVSSIAVLVACTGKVANSTEVSNTSDTLNEDSLYAERREKEIATSTHYGLSVQTKTTVKFGNSVVAIDA